MLSLLKTGFDDFLMRDFNYYQEVEVKTLEDKTSIRLRAPGLKKKKFNVYLEGNKLHIRYKGEEYFQSRYFTIDDSHTAKDIHASYTDGILQIDIPKVERNLIEIT